MSTRNKTVQVAFKSLAAALVLGGLGMSTTAEAACTPAGTFYDNTANGPDVKFVYQGNWTHSSSFPQALYGTLSWSKELPFYPYPSLIIEKSVSFELECRTSFDFFYTAAHNRGQAIIHVQNKRTGEFRQLSPVVDQYSPTVKHAQSVNIKIPWTERTIVYINPNGSKNPSSSDTYIDIDAIVPR